MKKISAAAIACLALALTAAPAFAAPEAAPKPATPAMAAAKPPAPTPASGPAVGSPKDAMNARLNSMKTELAITPAQEASWNGFADAMKKRAENMSEMVKARQAATSATPPARMEMQIKFMESNLNNLKQVQPALATLYNGLSAEQKKKADTLLGMGPGTGGPGPGGPN